MPKSIIQKDNEYYPIQWSALKECKIGEMKIENYQGVITNKDLIKKKCFELIKEINDGHKEFDYKEWVEIKKIIDQIVFSFKE